MFLWTNNEGDNSTDRINDEYNSLRYKKCESFIMKYEPLFIEIFPLVTVAGHVIDTPWSWRFPPSPPSLSGDNEWFSSYCGNDHGGEGGYFLPRDFPFFEGWFSSYCRSPVQYIIIIWSGSGNPQWRRRVLPRSPPQNVFRGTFPPSLSPLGVKNSDFGA
jgi:hypothetical protein